MTTDSVWLIESKVGDEWILPVAGIPSFTESGAEYRVRIMTRSTGGEYRAVEYKRVSTDLATNAA